MISLHASGVANSKIVVNEFFSTKRQTNINFMKTKVIAVLILFLITKSFAQNNNTGWTVLKRLQPTLPNPLIGINNHTNNSLNIFYNPAVACYIKTGEVGFVTESGVADDIANSIVYHLPLLNNFSLVFGGSFYDAGKIELVWNESGVKQTKTVSSQSDVLGLVSFGYSISSKILVGSTIKVINSRLIETISYNAIACDFGVLYSPLIYSKNNIDYIPIIISFTTQNLGLSSTVVNATPQLPTVLDLGVNYTTSFDDLKLDFGFTGSYFVNSPDFVPSFGVGLTLMPISVFLGYKADELNYETSLGFCVTLNKMWVSYLYIPHQWLNHTHRISSGIKF